MARAMRERERQLTADERDLVARAYVLLPAAVRRHRRLLRAAGLSADDAQHELLLAFIGRLRGAHPFDPARAGLGTYLHLLARSLLTNWAARAERRAAGLTTLSGYAQAAEQADTEGLVAELLDAPSVCAGEGSIEPPGFPNMGGVVGAPNARPAHPPGVFSDQEMPTPPPRRRRRAV